MDCCIVYGANSKHTRLWWVEGARFWFFVLIKTPIELRIAVRVSVYIAILSAPIVHR